jgi:hypothetical protein
MIEVGRAWADPDDPVLKERIVGAKPVHDHARCDAERAKPCSKAQVSGRLRP